MKILHLVAGELNGGAARGAYWLHQALRDLGVESSILTNARDNLGDESVISLADSTISKAKFAMLYRMGQLPLKLYRHRGTHFFSAGIDGVDVTRNRAYGSADLVNLHWINGLASTRSLGKIKKPLVWTLRDMWPMTGGCHQSLGCERYRIACGACPQLGSSRERDLTRMQMRRKRRSLPRHMHIVGISRWLSACARESALFRDYPITTIGNNVDTQTFRPIDKQLARRVLGLDEYRKVLLVGAQNVMSPYKGFDLFLEALSKLDKDFIQVLLFGQPTVAIPESLGIPSNNLGFLADSIALRLAYSAADAFVAPSRADAFGKTLAEAMACGTPVVCFDATGPRDIVEHQITGYRAEPFSASDLARGIEYVLGQPPGEYQQMCDNSRMRAKDNFDSRIIAEKYIALYENILGGRSENA
jgi:glycosyltransferase involved in cell wall biosynthesis